MDENTTSNELLREIRDNQRIALENQAQHIELVRQQLGRSKVQVAESLDLQRQAMAKARLITRIALPGVIACIALIAYLVIRYF